MKRACCKLLAIGVLSGAFVFAGCSGDEEPAEDHLKCGTNTVLEDGQCVPEQRCDEGEIVTPRGACEPEDIFCGEGSAFDGELEKCVSLADVVCGPGTVESGGRCVVEDPLHCGEHTVLYDESCELEEDVCGEGTEFDALHCHPSEDACDAGAQWDVGSGECVDLEAVTCGETTVEHDDACVPMGSAADELATEADIDFADGDPIVPTDGESFVFTGTMDDNLTHSFDVEATEGQWLEVTIIARGLPSPGFDFQDSDADWRRSAVPGMVSLPTRTVVTPADDTFDLTVVSRYSDDASPSDTGSLDWQYVGTVDIVDAPDTYQWDYITENLDGDLRHTDYNLIEVDVSETDEVLVEPQYLGDDAEEPTLEVWEDLETFSTRHDLELGEELSVDVDDVDTIYFHIDAAAFYGTNTDFELSAMSTETLEPGQLYEHHVYAEAGEVIFIAHESDQAQEMTARVYFDDEIQYELDEVLASNESSYTTSETNREFFFAAEAGEYVVEFDNTSSSTATGFLSTSYTDEKPTFEIDGPDVQSFEATMDADGAGRGDWQIAVVYTSEPALVDVAIDIDTGTVPNAQVFNSQREEIEREANSTGTTEIDFLAEEPGAYFVAAKPGLTAISGDIEFALEGYNIDIMEPGEMIEETFDVDAFDLLRGHISYDDGEHVDLRLLNPDDVVIFEETAVELSSSEQWSFMELFPGPGEFTLQFENTGEDRLIAPVLEAEVSEAFDSITLEQDVDYEFERGTLTGGDREILIAQAPDTMALNIEALMGIDLEGILRVWNVDTGTLVAEQEDMLLVETSAFTEPGGIYAIEFEAVTELPDGYDMSLSTAESSVFELTETSSPNIDIPDNDASGITDILNVSNCANIMDIEVELNITHTWIGDLIVEVTSPGGITARLHDRSGGMTNNINATYPEPGDSNLDDGEELYDMEGENGSGEWEIFVSDNAPADTGTLDDWTLSMTCEG